MNFALLGDDAAAWPLVEAITASDHRLVRAAMADRVLATSPRLTTIARGAWEELLTDAAVEAIIVAGESDDVQFAAKQLASAGKPLLIVPKAAFGAGCAYELSLIADDSPVVLMPAFEQRFDPELIALARRMAAHELGTVRRLNVEVELPPVADLSKSIGLTDTEIDEASLADIDLLRWLGGDFDQVTALRSGHTEQGHYSQATLTLSGDGLPDATWTARRGTERKWKLTVETDREPSVIQRGYDTSGAVATCCQSLLHSFAKALQLSPPSEGGARRGNSDRTATESLPTPPAWPAAVRVFDVLDAARRSLRRRRTIDLHFESLSERSQFKTQMTAVGCGLLLLTLVLMVAFLGLGSLLESQDRALTDAAKSGLVLTEFDFEPQSERLSRSGLSRLAEIARTLSEEPKSLYLQPDDRSPNDELNQLRRQQVVKELHEMSVAAADHRTLLAPPKSAGWEFVLRVLRLAWLAPLVLFLALQLLLFVAKPSATGR